MDSFEQLKASIDILDVALQYGLEVNRHGKALCPFHADKNPSLSFKNGRYKCFVCEASGDSIDFVADIQGITLLAAAKELDSQYGLNLFQDKPLNQSERKKAHEKKMQRLQDRDLISSFDEWEQTASNTVANYLNHMQDWKCTHAPKSFDDEYHPLFIEACHFYDFWDWIYSEVFIYGNFETKVEFYQNYAEGVKKIEERFKNITGEGKNAS